jgi:hypothetical protein
MCYNGLKEENDMSLDEKWSKEKNPLQPIKNGNLVCESCEHCTKAVVSCKIYETKPVSVLKGGVCYEYKKQ